MAKVKFNSQKAANDLLVKLERVKRAKSMNNEIGLFLVKTIKGSARAGKPLNDGGKFKSLKDLTIAQRQRLAQFNKTHPSFSPSRSNLTFSGQLIDAVSFEVSNGILVVDIDDTPRKPYKTGPNSRQKNPPTNKDLQKFLISISRTFSVFTGRAVKANSQVGKRVKAIVLKTLRRSLRKS